MGNGCIVVAPLADGLAPLCRHGRCGLDCALLSGCQVYSTPSAGSLASLPPHGATRYWRGVSPTGLDGLACESLAIWADGCRYAGIEPMGASAGTLVTSRNNTASTCPPCAVTYRRRTGHVIWIFIVGVRSGLAAGCFCVWVRASGFAQRRRESRDAERSCGEAALRLKPPRIGDGLHSRHLPAAQGNFLRVSASSARNKAGPKPPARAHPPASSASAQPSARSASYLPPPSGAAR